MYSHRFHRYSQMFLRKLKSVLICVICGRILLKQHIIVLPQIPQIFTDVLEKTKICVSLRNQWANTSQAAYECSPADFTDIQMFLSNKNLC